MKAKQTDPFLKRLQEQREWKNRARSAEKEAINDPNVITIRTTLLAIADWHEYGQNNPNRAVGYRKLANDPAYCEGIAELWRVFNDMQAMRWSIVGKESGIAGLLSKPWLFYHADGSR